MPMQANFDEAELYARARELLAAGKLPCGEPSGMWGGGGRGEACCVCLKPVQQDEIAFDLLFPTPEAKVELHMHSHCRIVWEQARQIE
jgi:hypothetical protein